MILSLPLATTDACIRDVPLHPALTDQLKFLTWMFYGA